MKTIESLREKFQFALVCVTFALLMHPGTLFNDTIHAHEGEDTEHPVEDGCEDDPDCRLPQYALSYYKNKDCSDSPKHFHTFTGAVSAGYNYYNDGPSDKSCHLIKVA